MKKYKMIAISGILLMGISSFLACLGHNDFFIQLGNIGIIASIFVMAHGFKVWQP